MYGPVEVQYFPEVAAAGLEVLRQQASHEQLKRYIRKQQNRQLTPEDAELLLFELEYLLAEQASRLLALLKRLVQSIAELVLRHSICSLHISDWCIPVPRCTVLV